ncbi:MAG: PilZ domain-containing protein [Lachnospiraceae bacterium]|nr:PilZ domain-containing protein [Lachnospiraceae bacterium]
MEGRERRRNKRLELESRLIIKRLDGGTESEQVAIQVADVSKAGLGFSCTIPLEIGAVYEAYLTIWTKEVIHAFVEIVRIEKEEETFRYGGVFIGMPEIDAARIEIYDTVNNKDE